MTFWTAETLRAAMNGAWLHHSPSAPSQQNSAITGVSTDSRSIKPGQVFVALKGPTHDGHGYLKQASDAGAAILVVDDPSRVPDQGAQRPGGAGVIRVADCRQALLDLARAYRATLTRTRVIAVCGSNGKTTTTRLIDHALRAGGGLSGSSSPKSFNNTIGVPLTILAAREDDDYVVCEAGTSSPGEIAVLGSVLRPDVAVITSIGREHLENLKDLAGVAEEEAAILGFVMPGGLAVIPADSPELTLHLTKALTATKALTLRTVGLGESADLRPSGLRHAVIRSGGSAGIGVEFSCNGRAVRLPLMGAHNALNALTALAVARHLGIDEARAAAALGSATGVEMRLRLRDIGGVTLIDDAYNANPDSTIAGLRTLESVRRALGSQVARTAVVLGEMLELGAASAEGHRAVAQEIDALGGEGSVELAVLVGPGMEAARDELARLGWPPERVRHFADCAQPRDAQIAGLFAEGDLVLVKGSRGVRLERVIGALERVRSAVATE